MEGKARNPPAFDKQAFVDKVLAEVAKIAPPTMDDFLKFAKRSKAEKVKAAVTGEVHHVDSGYHTVGMMAVDAAPEVVKLLRDFVPQS